MNSPNGGAGMTGSGQMRELDLKHLRRGLGEMTAAKCATWAEAATCLLQDCLGSGPYALSHRCGESLGLIETFKLTSLRMTKKIVATYSDKKEAADDGAMGVAVLLVARTTDYTVLKRSAAMGEGHDFHLCKEGSALFGASAYLEVSGIGVNRSEKAESRLKEKLKQVKGGTGCDLPIFVVIVDFRQPLSLVVLYES